MVKEVATAFFESDLQRGFDGVTTLKTWSGLEMLRAGL